MTSRLIRVQLSIFALVTVVCIGVIATMFLHLPAAVGIGSYNVTADFETGGGLYQNANVTYRGVTVGRVESVELTDTGVQAHMRLNTATRIPSDVSATVKSVSAVGEQYVDLVPRPDHGPALLRDGSRISQDNTAVGEDITALLQQADALVDAVGNTRIHDLLRETFKAFNGSGPELSRLIGASRVLVDEANSNYLPTSQLIDQAQALLDSQIRSGDDIKSTAGGLARFTDELRTADQQIRTTLRETPPTADVANALMTGIRPSFPVLAATLANFGRIGVIYRKAIEQVLVILPAQYAAFLTVAGQLPADEGGKLDFKVSLQDPPPCETGFLPPTEIRSPADQTLRLLPNDLYCKVPHNDPSAVRGARNYPCQEFPGKRAPTVALCRDPNGYVPVGNNPWRGPPVPVGTPITDPRNILPPNKYPYIPPQVDPDPGPPVVQLPPGVPPGPGPAPHAPFPLPFPPNEPGPPPPPWPYYAPPDQQVPPYGVPPPPPPPAAPAAPLPAEAPASDAPPQASGQRVVPYDESTGVFNDPAGGTAIFRPGENHPAENWVDLMLDSRPM
ncbi:MCE family protein [Mycobacterium sp. 3519A]|uniref:MCE family protein n=1 Tax=Mycobacterium sp. 3519A TaxID=2057184 RepID=UPI000C7CDDF4|nr:MCE family protein [Mycobacterium sp. 3519A]